MFAVRTPKAHEVEAVTSGPLDLLVPYLHECCGCHRILGVSYTRDLTMHHRSTHTMCLACVEVYYGKDHVEHLKATTHARKSATNPGGTK